MRHTQRQATQWGRQTQRHDGHGVCQGELRLAEGRGEVATSRGQRATEVLPEEVTLQLIPEAGVELSNRLIKEGLFSHREERTEVRTGGEQMRLVQ